MPNSKHIFKITKHRGTLVISIFSSQQFMLKWSNFSLTSDFSHAPKIKM